MCITSKLKSKQILPANLFHIHIVVLFGAHVQNKNIFSVNVNVSYCLFYDCVCRNKLLSNGMWNYYYYYYLCVPRDNIRVLHLLRHFVHSPHRSMTAHVWNDMELSVAAEFVIELWTFLLETTQRMRKRNEIILKSEILLPSKSKKTK